MPRVKGVGAGQGAAGDSGGRATYFPLARELRMGCSQVLIVGVRSQKSSTTW